MSERAFMDQTATWKKLKDAGAASAPASFSLQFIGQCQLRSTERNARIHDGVNRGIDGESTQQVVLDGIRRFAGEHELFDGDIKLREVREEVIRVRAATRTATVNGAIFPGYRHGEIFHVAVEHEICGF